jgi:hypothetical protein
MFFSRPCVVRAVRSALQLQPLRRGLILLIVAAVLISATVSVRARRSRIRDPARRNREIGYAVALSFYSKALHPGVTREEVETYLRAANTQFGWVYTAFGGRRESQSADIVKIGEEKTSAWFCGAGYVHVAFEFSPVDNMRTTSTYHLPGQLIRGEDTDVLQRIEIFRVQDCL